MILYLQKTELYTANNGLQILWKAFNSLVDFGGYGPTQEDAEADFFRKFNDHECAGSVHSTTQIEIHKL